MLLPLLKKRGAHLSHDYMDESMDATGALHKAVKDLLAFNDKWEKVFVKEWSQPGNPWGPRAKTILPEALKRTAEMRNLLKRFSKLFSDMADWDTGGTDSWTGVFSEMYD